AAGRKIPCLGPVAALAHQNLVQEPRLSPDGLVALGCSWQALKCQMVRAQVAGRRRKKRYKRLFRERSGARPHFFRPKSPVPILIAHPLRRARACIRGWTPRLRKYREPRRFHTPGLIAFFALQPTSRP